MSTVAAIRKDFRTKSRPKRVKDLKWFFKTEKGGYGEGDQFLGHVVPDTRAMAKKHYSQMDFKGIESFLTSKFHEERLFALICLGIQYSKSKELKDKKKIIGFYLKHSKFVNNWDLVDSSAPYLSGKYLLDGKIKDLGFMDAYSKSKNLWKKRIAMLSCAPLISEGETKRPLVIADRLLEHEHDLTHKAVGWMLRELGKRHPAVLRTYIRKNYDRFPRTCLRYAIEKFPEKERKSYLRGQF